jgi:hypothetical protein
MVVIIGSGRAITTVPACQARTLLSILTDVVAIPVRDARPAVLALVWREDNQNPLVHALAELAGKIAEDPSAVGT